MAWFDDPFVDRNGRDVSWADNIPWHYNGEEDEEDFFCLTHDRNWCKQCAICERCREFVELVTPNMCESCMDNLQAEQELADAAAGH